MKSSLILIVLLTLYFTNAVAQQKPAATDNDAAAAKKPKTEQKPRQSDSSTPSKDVGWVEVTPTSGSFKILMPGQPKESSQEQENGRSGKTELHLLQLKDGNNFYQVGFVEMHVPDKLDKNSKLVRDVILRGLITGTVKSMNGELISKTTIHHKNSEGLEAQIKLPTAIVWSRVFFINGLGYSLIFGSPTNAPDTQKKFFNSFTIK